MYVHIELFQVPSRIQLGNLQAVLLWRFDAICTRTAAYILYQLKHSGVLNLFHPLPNLCSLIHAVWYCFAAGYFVKHLEIEDRKVYFQIWDTAGQENFRSLVPMFLRDAKIALLVYDITSMVGKITHAKSWGVLGQRISINTSMFFVRIRSYKWNK